MAHCLSVHPIFFDVPGLSLLCLCMILPTDLTGCDYLEVSSKAAQVIKTITVNYRNYDVSVCDGKNGFMFEGSRE
jgi:hypothetical protein